MIYWCIDSESVSVKWDAVNYLIASGDRLLWFYPVGRSSVPFVGCYYSIKGIEPKSIRIPKGPNSPAVIFSKWVDNNVNKNDCAVIISNNKELCNVLRDKSNIGFFRPAQKPRIDRENIPKELRLRMDVFLATEKGKSFASVL